MMTGLTTIIVKQKGRKKEGRKRMTGLTTILVKQKGRKKDLEVPFLRE